ncbi:MAG: DEAD/DEAH box helicase, partial [Candidatus Nanohaloarchaea archaeon]
MELFPFSEVRERQDELMAATRDAIKDGESLVAHAPTGLGKTAATLTPAIEYAKENNKKVFFLTPRHSQHSIAVETVKKMQERHSVELTVIDLLGKKWLCNVDGVEEMTSRDFKDYCQTLRDEERCDFYTAMYDMDE